MDFEWSEHAFGELCTITRGASPRPINAFLSKTGMPWIKIADATSSDSRFLEATNECIKLEGVKSSVRVFPGDLILSNSATPGLPKFVMLDACIHDGWMLLRNFKGLDKNYAYWLLLNERKNLVAQGNGSVFTNLKTDILKLHRVRIPDLATQAKIAQIFGSIADKIDFNRRINQTLEAMAQAIFKSWFVDFDPVKAKIAAIEQGQDPLRAAMCAISGKTDAELDQMPREHHDQLAATAALFPEAMEESELGEIPKGWEISDFGSVSVCFDKNRIPLSKRQREDKKGNIPYYGATSVMDYVGEHIFDGVFLLLGEDGSVLREDGTPFVQYIWGKSWVNNHAHVLQGANGVSTEQLMLFISMQNISAYVTGAVQLKLNQKNMNSIPFVKATKDINAMFSRLIAPLYAKYRSMVEEIHSLTEYRDTLLPKLLSGELSVDHLSAEAVTT